MKKRKDQKMALCNFKKMAMMGLAGGLLLSAGAEANEGQNQLNAALNNGRISGYLAQGGCSTCGGGKIGYAGHQGGCGAAPSQNYNYSMQSGCHSNDYQPYYPSQNYGYQPQSDYNRQIASQPQSSCSARRQNLGDNYQNQESRWLSASEANMPSQGVYDERGVPLDQNRANQSDNLQRKGYIADAEMMSQQHKAPMTESELMSHLNAQGKAAFKSLTAEGKALALQYAQDPKYQDKNEAVKAAAAKMAEKRNNAMNRPSAPNL